MDDSGLKLQSLITEDGRLEVFLTEEAIPELRADEVLVKVQAARFTRLTLANYLALPIFPRPDLKAQPRVLFSPPLFPKH